MAHEVVPLFNVQLAGGRRISYITRMKMDAHDRAMAFEVFLQDAEMLAVSHLDLLAQLERQLRAVHQTMRHIDKLRNLKRRVEPVAPLSTDQSEAAPTNLDEDIEVLDSHLHVEHSCCSHMRDTIIKMQARVTDLRRRASAIDASPSDT
jgi:hypothetical protein